MVRSGAHGGHKSAEYPPRSLLDCRCDAPAQAVVLSVDEKSQIRALDRTQPGLPGRSRRVAACALAMAGPVPCAGGALYAFLMAATLACPSSARRYLLGACASIV